MSLNTSMPYYRNTSREVKTIREVIQQEAIKSARLMSRDKIKMKQNTSIGDLNRSKRKSNNSFYDNRNNSQIENTNILQTYLANAFQPESHYKEFQIQQNKDNKQREIKYLMRIATLEKETQKLSEMISKLKRENHSLKTQDTMFQQIQTQLNITKNENLQLTKQVAILQSLRKSQKIYTPTTQASVDISTTTQQPNIIPSYMLALSLAE